MDIIGLGHDDFTLNALGDYMAPRYIGSKVLVEQDPNSPVDNGIKSTLEEYLHNCEFISGDLECRENQGLLGYILKRRAKKLEMGVNYPVSEKIKDFALQIPGDFSHLAHGLNPYIMNRRNSGMIKAVIEFKPDVAVLGYAHAVAVKKSIPKTRLIRFSSGMCYDRAMGLFEWYYGVKPDQVVSY